MLQQLLHSILCFWDGAGHSIHHKVSVNHCQFPQNRLIKLFHYHFREEFRGLLSVQLEVCALRLSRSLVIMENDPSSKPWCRMRGIFGVKPEAEHVYISISIQQFCYLKDQFYTVPIPHWKWISPHVYNFIPLKVSLLKHVKEAIVTLCNIVAVFTSSEQITVIV